MIDLLAELGAEEPERAAEIVARHNSLRDTTVSKGTALQIPDEIASALVHAGSIEGATPMKALGIHAVSALLDAANADGDPQGLGKLLALAAIHLPDLVPGNVESGQLSLSLPLAPGRFRLPLSNDQSLEVEVPRGTTVAVEVDLVPTASGPKIGSASIHSSAPLRVRNHADLSIFRGSPVASLANRFLSVSLDRIEVAKDGSLAIGAMVGGLPIPIPSSMLPKVELDAQRLLEGKVVRDRSLLVSVPDRIDPTALLGAMGAMAEQGTFSLTLHGKNGTIDVGRSGIGIRGRTSPVIASISGDFGIDDRGRIQVTFDARTNVKDVDAHVTGSANVEVLRGQISGNATLEGRARPTKPIEIDMPIEIAIDDQKVGAKLGHLEVAHDREGMKVHSGRRWFGVEKAAERKLLLLAIGDRTSITLDRDAMISGDLSFHLGTNGLQLQSNGINVSFELAGTKIDNQQLALRLGEGSALEATISRLSLDEQGGLRLDDLHAGFQIRIEGGRFDHGMLSAALDSGRLNALEGTIALSRTDGGATLDSQASVTVHALPKVSGVFGLGVEKTGTMRARITREGVVLAPGESDVSWYRRK